MRTPQSGTWSHGWIFDNGNNMGDAKADIFVTDPYIHTEGDSNKDVNTSYSWVMLASSASGCGSLGCWGQLGPAKFDDGTRGNLGQCYNDNTHAIATFEVGSTETAGTTHTYNVKNVSGGKEFIIDGSILDECTWSFTPQDDQAANEVNNYADQIQGNTSTHQTWTNGLATESSGTAHSFFANTAGGGYGYRPSSGPASWDKFSAASGGDTQTADGWDGGC